MLKGALHLHSTYSDGDFTLPELRAVLVAEGCRFACITDHADWFDAAAIDRYVRECEQWSDDQFRFIAGLEFGCIDRMHVLGLGVTDPIDSSDPQEVIRHIDRHGGVAVIAHPKNDAFAWIETFETLPNGVETWNSKYDGRYAPRPATFALLARLKTRRPGMTAYYGQDLHWRTQYRGLFTMVDCATPDRAAVLDALARGAYAGMKDGLELPASGEVTPELLVRFARAQGRSRRLRTWMTRAKRWCEAAGVSVPPKFKAQLRRMF